MLDLLRCTGVHLTEPAERPLNFFLANRLRPETKHGEERLDFELSVATPERLDLLVDDRLDLRNLAQPGSERAVEAGPKIVDVEQAHPVDVAGSSLDVGGDRKIDENERALGPTRNCRPNHLSADDGLLGARRSDGDVGPGERILELVEPVRGATESRHRLSRPRPGPVRSGNALHAATRRRLQRLESDAPRTDDKHMAVAQVSQDPLRERERHRARGRRIRPDRGLRARPPTGCDRGPEEQRECRAGSLPRVLESVSNLSQDLRLTENERVEPCRHAGEMTRNVLARVDVEVVDERRAVDRVRVRESVDQRIARAFDAVDEVRVQLDAVARRKNGVLGHLRAALGPETESAESLAQLDWSRAVAETEADEALHDATNTLLSTPTAQSVIENGPVRALGVDVGGTYTDAVLVDEGVVRTAKVPTAPNQEASVLAAAAQVGAGDLDRFTHGTTIATNALLERDGARTAFVATAGFEHLLHLRRQTRAHLYRPCAEHSAPLVPLERCTGVSGRMGPEGELEPLDLDSLDDLDADAIAVCLLFSFRHPQHEQAVVSELRRRHPKTHIVASHEVAPEFREYERASTTVVDAYLGPVLGRYLHALSDACSKHGLPQALVMRSSGGLATLEEAARHAAFALLSGPAAGVVGASYVAALAGFEDALAFDMGGTSTDVCAIVGGEARREHERAVGGFPVRLPTLAVHTVGAGGGSIVWEDTGGALRVGPESAGADPGPACYGRGGERPTVTDANLLLGRLPPHLAGGVDLDRDAAGRALADLDPSAVIEVVNAEMVRALRVVSVEQGLDPRDFALVAFGGAGPLHACALAEQLGMTTVLVPAAAGVLSALGLVAADERYDAVRSYVVPLSDAGELPEEGEADLRYAGQSFELTVPLGSGLSGRFHAAHAERYGYEDRDRALELVAVRTAEVRAAPGIALSGPHAIARGPEVLELEGATAWVPEGWAGETDTRGTLVLRWSG